MVRFLRCVHVFFFLLFFQKLRNSLNVIFILPHMFSHISTQVSVSITSSNWCSFYFSLFLTKALNKTASLVCLVGYQLGEKVSGNYIRTVHAILSKSWNQHSKKTSVVWQFNYIFRRLVQYILPNATWSCTRVKQNQKNQFENSWSIVTGLS